MEFSRQSARLPKTGIEKDQWRRAIVILEHCPLESIQTDGGDWELLCDRHRRTLAERKIDPADFRPDVVHQTLLHLLDSPLNRAGALQVFIRSHKGVLISVDPRLHIPRSFRLFSKMMANLLYKLKVKAKNAMSNRLSLLKVIPNPITEHLPENVEFIRIEKDGELVEPFSFCQGLAAEATKHMKRPTFGLGAEIAARRRKRRGRQEDDDSEEDDSIPVWEREENQQREGGESGSARAHAFLPFAFVIGGMSRGDVEVEYRKADGEAIRSIRLANRGMSAAAAASLLCHAIEEVWVTEAATC